MKPVLALRSTGPYVTNQFSRMVVRNKRRAHKESCSITVPVHLSHVTAQGKRSFNCLNRHLDTLAWILLGSWHSLERDANNLFFGSMGDN